MNTDYEHNAKIVKALSDSSRLKIVDILSCGEMCACDMLQQAHIISYEPYYRHR